MAIKRPQKSLTELLISNTPPKPKTSGGKSVSDGGLISSITNKKEEQVYTPDSTILKPGAWSFDDPKPMAPYSPEYVKTHSVLTAKPTPITYSHVYDNIEDITTTGVNNYLANDGFRVTTITPDISAKWAENNKTYSELNTSADVSLLSPKDILTGKGGKQYTADTGALSALEEAKNLEGVDTELWMIEDGDALPHQVGNYKVIGRNRLYGVKVYADAVVYDRGTGQLYQWQKDDETSKCLKKDRESASEQMSNTADFVNTIVEHKQEQLTRLQQELEDTYKSEGITDNYVAKEQQYTKAVEDANKLFGKLNEQYSTVYSKFEEADKAYQDYGVFGMDEAFEEQVNNTVKGFKDVAKYDGIMADFDNSTKANSFKDAFINLGNSIFSAPGIALAAAQDPNRTYSDIYKEEIAKGAFGDPEYWGSASIVQTLNYKARPFIEAYKGNLTLDDMLKAVVNNYLGDIGETVDLLGAGEVKAIAIPLYEKSKAFLEASKNDEKFEVAYNRLVEQGKIGGDSVGTAMKKYFNLHTDEEGNYTGAESYNWDTGSTALNLLLEIVSDPQLAVSAIGKGITKSAIKTAAQSEIDDLSSELGLKATDNIIKRMTSQAWHGSLDDIQDIFTKEMQKSLTSTAETAAENSARIAQSASNVKRALDTTQFRVAKALQTTDKAIDTATQAALMGTGKAICGLFKLAQHGVKDVSTIIPMVANRLKGTFDGEFLAKGVEPVEAVNRVEDTIHSALDIAGIVASRDADVDAMKAIYNMYATREVSSVLETLKYSADFTAADELVTKLTDGKYTKLYTGGTDDYFTAIRKNIMTPALSDSGKTIMRILEDNIARITYKQQISTLKKGYKSLDKTMKDLSNVRKRVTDPSVLVSATAQDLRVTYLKAISTADDMTTHYAKGLNKYFDANIVDAVASYKLAMHDFITQFESNPTVVTKVEQADEYLRTLVDKYNDSLEDLRISVSNVTHDFSPTPEAVWKDLDISDVTEGFTSSSFAEELVNTLWKDGKTVTLEDVQSCFTDTFKKVDGDRLYAVTQSDVSATVSYLSNEELAESAKVLLDRDTGVRGYLETVNKSVTDLDTFRISRNLTSDIMGSDIDAELKVGILDTLGKSNSAYAQNVINKADLTTAYGYDNATDTLTDMLCNKAEFYRNRREALTLHNLRIGSETVHFTAVDTEANVLNLMKHMDNPVLASASKAISDVDKHNNIFFSLSRFNDTASPYAVTVGTSPETMRTFINGDVEFGLTDTLSRKYHGTDLETAHTEYDTFVKAHHTDVYSHDDFITSIRDYLAELSEDTTDHMYRSNRYVGYNCSEAGTGQTKSLMSLMRNEVLRTYVSDVQDVANFVRADRGYAYFSDSARATVRTAVRNALQPAVIADFIRAPKPNIIAVADAHTLNELNAAISHITAVKKGSVLDHGYNILSKDSADAMYDALVRAQAIINDNIEASTAFNKKYTKQFLNEEKFAELCGRLDYSVGDHVNIMRTLYKNVAKDKALTGNVQLLVSNEYIAQHLNLDAVNAILKTSYTTLDDFMGYARQLDHKITGIRNMELVSLYTPEQYSEFIDLLFNKYVTNDMYTRSALLQIVNVAKKADPTPTQAWAYLDTVLEVASKGTYNGKSFAVAVGADMVDKPYLKDMLAMYFYKDSCIYNTTMQYTPGMSAIASRFAQPTSAMNQYAELTSEFNKVKSYFNSTEATMEMYNHTLDKHGLSNAAARVHTTNLAALAKPVQDFMQVVTDFANAAYSTYLHAIDFNSAPTAVVKQRNMFSDNMRNITRAFNKLADTSNYTKAQLVFGLPEDAIEGHIIKNCHNILNIDMKSGLFVNSLDMLEAAKNFMKSAKQAGLTVTSENSMVHIYKDLSQMSEEEVSELVLKYKDFDVSLDTSKVYNAFIGMSAPKEYANLVKRMGVHYKAMLEELTKYMPSQYFLSDFNAASIDSYETLKSTEGFVPDAAKIDSKIFQLNGMFDASFNCNFIGDYAGTERVVYDKMSTNVFSNIMSGINMVKDSLDYVQDAYNLFTNKYSSFRNVMENCSKPGITWQEARDAIAQNGMVAYKATPVMKGEDIVRIRLDKIDIDSEKAYQMAMHDDGTLLTDNTVYEYLFELTKHTNKEYKLAQANGFSKVGSFLTNTLIKNVRSAYVSGWLKVNPGTWVNNYIDANGKALVQTRSTDYMRTRFTINKRIRDYDAISIEMQKLRKTYNVTPDIIDKYFKEHTDLAMSKQEYLNMYAIQNHSAGSVSPMLEAYSNDAVNRLSKSIQQNAGLSVEQSLDLVNRGLPTVRKMYNKYGNGEGINKLTYYRAVEDELTKAGTYTDDEVKALIEASAYYRNSSIGGFQKLGKLPVLKQLLGFNEQMFSTVENQVRMALGLHYIENVGMTVSQAMQKVEQSQFNYALRSDLMDKFDILFPFSTFKIYNMKFWLVDAVQDTGMLKPMLRWLNASDFYLDEAEINQWMSLAHYKAQIANGDIDLEEIENTDPAYQVLLNTIEDDVNEYTGANALTSKLGGHLSLDANHMFKFGNSYLDSIDFFTSVMTIPQQILKGDYNAFITQNIFTPAVTAFNLAKFMWTNRDLKNSNPAKYNAAKAKFIKDNEYDLVDIMPILGALANNIISMKRNYNAADYVAFSMFPDLGELAFDEARGTLYDVAATFLPGLFQITKGDTAHMPVGYDWYNQTEEYRKTHRYVTGVSYVPTWVTKDPTTYVNSLAEMIRVGYTEQEAKSLMNDSWYVDKQGVLRNYEDNNSLPSTIRYDSEMYQNTLEALIKKGYTPDQALSIMKKGIDWVDTDGKAVTPDEAEEAANSEFLAYWDSLPSYVKYEEGQYSKLYKYYHDELNYTNEQSKIAIKAQLGYIDANGTFNILTPEAVQQKAEEREALFNEYYTQLPDFLKYEPGAYSRTLKFVEQNYNVNADRAKQMILQNNLYVDENNKFYQLTDAEVEQRNAQNKSEFYGYFAGLPSTTRYEKGAYSRTLAHLKELGYDTDEAKQMIQDGYYISADGKVSNVKGVVYKKGYSYSHKKYTYYRRTYSRRKRMFYPKRYYAKRQYATTAKIHGTRSQRAPFIVRITNSRTYSRQNVLAGASHGIRRVYFINNKQDVNRSALSLKSAYPAAYRNIRFGYRHSMYNDLYAKYGTSRMLMRSGTYKSYSNPSVTRLRREHIQYENKYSSERDNIEHKKGSH